MFTFGSDNVVARVSVRGFRAGIDLGMLVLAVCVHADAGWLDGGGCCRGWACGWLAAGCYGGTAAGGGGGGRRRGPGPGGGPAAGRRAGGGRGGGPGGGGGGGWWGRRAGGAAARRGLG